MKVSKRAIKELFINDEFSTLLKNYFSGDFDPYDYDHWLPASWGASFFKYSMDMDGAKGMKRLTNLKNAYSLNVTQKSDSDFSVIAVDDTYASVLIWILDLIGFKYEEMRKFDAYEYEDFNMWITTNGL